MSDKNGDKLGDNLVLYDDGDFDYLTDADLEKIKHKLYYCEEDNTWREKT